MNVSNSTEASSGPAVYHVIHGNNGTMRNGGLTPDKAYNGTHGRLFYHTPSEFFSSSKAIDADRADTARGKVLSVSVSVSLCHCFARKKICEFLS